MTKVTTLAAEEDPVLRVVHARGADESAAAFVERVASSLSFAFHLDAEVAERPGFDLLTRAMVLQNGVITRSEACGEFVLTRDQARVEASGADQLYILFVERGFVRIEPSLNPAATAGEVLVVDLAEASKLIERDQTVTCLIVARAALPPEAQRRRLNGCLVPASHPLASAISALAHELGTGVMRLRASHANALLEAVLALLGGVLMELSVVDLPAIPLKTAVETLVDNHLQEDDLSPAWLAAQLNVSRATLYRALQPYGGVRGLIRDRRLERASLLLVSDTPPLIGSIHKDLGFKSKAGFVKAFSAKFGISPYTLRNSKDGRHEAREQLGKGWNKRTLKPQD
ncbi:helix-turn-helix domain-containing protein [Caulobacter sp. S45]|uniref:helix-turn-helix domain-containing protein n=1 Tax=Caulobacter sp. S45 TaxID=1641861 RepID=UPI00157757AF|nr:AraC family transcriptional regulator [Caulobacter sp. S45]